MSWKALAAVLALGGCESSPKTTAPERLRVPMPDGWKATAVQGGLEVGPEGRVVLLLESTTRPLPEGEAFFGALAGENVEVTQKESVDTFVGARYLVGSEGSRREAFLGVRQAGPRTIWCSSSASAKSEEVEAAMTVCRSLSWEG